jgi:nucleoside-diphosphate kinase
MANETTLILVKPDGVRRHLIGEIVKRFEHKGLRIRGLKMMKMTEEMAAAHYAEHVSKPFYPELRDFIVSGPLVALAVEGPDAITLCRNLMGKTKAVEAQPGTIRGDFATTTGENLVHGSDSPESATRELGIFFKPEELF